MKTSEAFWQFLPAGLNELFEMVRFEKTDQSYDIWLDEKKKLSDEDYRNPNIVARGYTASRETVKRYNIVVGQFKQVFNARQMRERLMAGGYPDAFIIHTREPLYYVVTQTVATPEEALAAYERVKADRNIVLRDPLPFVLRPAHLAR